MAFKLHWWKFLAVALLLFVILSGVNIPLSPGISSISPESIEIGKPATFKVLGYNTHFLDAKANNNAWLQFNGNAICCSNSVEAIDNENVEVSFNFQGMKRSTEEEYLDLVFSNEIDGTISLKNALSFKPDSENSNLANSCKALEVKKALGTHFPNREILNETIRNLYFHVPMWFCMMVLMGCSLWFSILYLMKRDERLDMKAVEYVNTGLCFGIAGILTGMLWARFTWGDYWVKDDQKLNGAAIVLLEYLAYIVLRSSISDSAMKARVSAVYNVFAAASIIPLLFILPRINDSLHPGNGGNPAFKTYDLDNTMRLVFYPAVLGWILLGLWLASLRIRMRNIQHKLLDNE